MIDKLNKRIESFYNFTGLEFGVVRILYCVVYYLIYGLPFKNGLGSIPDYLFAPNSSSIAYYLIPSIPEEPLFWILNLIGTIAFVCILFGYKATLSSRGDMLVRENNKPTIEQDIDVMICWMNEKKMIPRGKYTIRHTSQTARCIIKEVKYKMDVNTLHRNEEDREIGLNDIGRVTIRTTKPLFFDSYRRNRNTGSIILVDEATNETVAAGMII